MKFWRSVQRFWLGVALVSLSILGATVLTPPRLVSAASSGTYFDHIVIIAMENTPYSSVFGSGSSSSCPATSAPFLCSMLPYSSTIPSMNNYGATSADVNDFNGCSAACYVGLLAGYSYGVSDGYSSISANLVVNSLQSSGLTWQAYCSESCPRGNDHFPFTAASGTAASSNIFTSNGVTYQSLISAANTASPPNFLWFTPTDNENMHDVSVSTGDSYLRSVLVGSGSITSPASGSLLASKLFTDSTYHTLLYLWWDECGGNNGSCDSNNDAPNLLYGSMVKHAYVSPDSAGMDEYASLWTIESNWGLSALAQGDMAAQSSGYTFNDIFTNGGNGPTGLSSSFTFSPTSISPNSPVAFSASATGGTAPYTYSWNFGDGNTATGANPSHTYATVGSYTITLTTTDNNGATVTKTQPVSVGGSSSPILSNDLWLLTIGLILGATVGTILYLTKYRSQNRRLRDTMIRNNQSRLNSSSGTSRTARTLAKRSKHNISEV